MFVLTKAAKEMHVDNGGPRGWLVVLASFFSQFIICGITYSIGIYHVLLKSIFNDTHFDTSWIASWLLYSTALSSICLRVITTRLGCRISVMLGGGIASAGLALSMVVTELHHLYITLGIMTGVGFGLACTPSIVAVETYFHNGRYQAIGIALGGIGVGMISFPLIIHFLLERYAWRGMFLVLAGIALNLCVCGALLKPQPAERRVALMPMFSTFALHNPLFHAMCWSNLLWSFGSTIVYVYLPSYAMSQGTDFNSCLFLIVCVGMAAFMSRLIYTFMGNTSTFDTMMQLLCSIGLGVVITGICPDMFEKFSGQIGYTLIFGFYSGYWTSFMSQVCRELIGAEYIAIGNGYLSSMVGLGALAAGPIAAWVLGENDSRYNLIFYMAGACLLISSFIMSVFKTDKFRSIFPERSDTKLSKRDLIDRKHNIVLKKLVSSD